MISFEKNDKNNNLIFEIHMLIFFCVTNLYIIIMTKVMSLLLTAENVQKNVATMRNLHAMVDQVNRPEYVCGGN